MGSITTRSRSSNSRLQSSSTNAPAGGSLISARGDSASERGMTRNAHNVRVPSARFPSLPPSSRGGSSTSPGAPHINLSRPVPMSERTPTLQMTTYHHPIDSGDNTTINQVELAAPSHDVDNSNGAIVPVSSQVAAFGGSGDIVGMHPCLNPASDINGRLDTQVEIKVYPCNNSHGKKKFTQFMVKPEGVIIQGTNRPPSSDIGTEYSRHIGRKLPRYELSDTRASQLLITSHHKSFFVVPAPEAFSRHSGTCRLLGDRKHSPTNHSLKVGDFLRVGSVGVVIIETHNGVTHDVMSEERIQMIMRDTTVGGYVDAEDTDVEENSDAENAGNKTEKGMATPPVNPNLTGDGYDVPTCYMCFDDEETDTNPLISPCKCLGDTRYVHVDCLRKWHTAEADNQICFLSTVDATCSVCKSSFKSDFKLKNGQLVKLFQSSLEPPYVSLLIATKHEMAQRLFNTRFQLSFRTLMRTDGRNASRPLLLGRSSGSDMVLDYRTVSARHASIKFKNGEFIFADAGSSNGSYLYVRSPVELGSNGASVQFRLGRSMISMKVVNKWNRRLLRTVMRRGTSSSTSALGFEDYNSGNDANEKKVDRKSREGILKSLPPLGLLNQQSHQHLDLVHALAMPKRDVKRNVSSNLIVDEPEEKVEEENTMDVAKPVEEIMAGVATAASDFSPNVAPYQEMENSMQDSPSQAPSSPVATAASKAENEDEEEKEQESKQEMMNDMVPTELGTVKEVHSHDISENARQSLDELEDASAAACAALAEVAVAR